jgi:hypothetical protein
MQAMGLGESPNCNIDFTIFLSVISNLFFDFYRCAACCSSYANAKFKAWEEGIKKPVSICFI